MSCSAPNGELSGGLFVLGAGRDVGIEFSGFRALRTEEESMLLRSRLRSALLCVSMGLSLRLG